MISWLWVSETLDRSSRQSQETIFNKIKNLVTETMEAKCGLSKEANTNIQFTNCTKKWDCGDSDLEVCLAGDSLWLSCSKISYQLPPISLPDSHRAGEERTYINLRTRLLFSSLFSSLLPQTKRLLLPYFLLFFLSHRLPFPPFPLEVSVIIVQKLHKNSLV